MITPKQIKVEGIEILTLMKIAGYQRHGDSWVRYFEAWDGLDNEKYRFHVYEKSSNLLEIHTDKMKANGKKKYHLASTFTTAPEKKRIKNIMPKV